MSPNRTFDDPANQGNASTYSDEELASRQQQGERDEDFKDRIDKQQQMEQERFEMADLEEKLQLSDDPMALVAKELKTLRSLSAEFIATNADLQEQIDELHDKSNDQVDVRDPVQVRGKGYNTIYDDGDGVIIDGEYNGPFSAYKKNATTITIRGGLILGGYDVCALLYSDDPDIGVESDVTGFSDGLNYVYIDISVDTVYGQISEAGTPVYGTATNLQDLNQISSWRELICIVDYDYDNSKIDRIIPRWDAGDIGIVVSFELSAFDGDEEYYAVRGIRGGTSYVSHNPGDAAHN